MDTFVKAFVVLSVAASVSTEGPFGGANPGFPGFQGGGYGGPAYGGAPAPGYSGSGPNFPPRPYSFGYDNTDEYGTRLFHNEQSDANNARTGSYGYRDAYGIFRTVRYVADANGFRATIDTNEPGTQAGASADAVFNANPVAAPAGAQYGAGRYGGSSGYAGGAPYGGYGSRGPWAG